MTGQKLIDWYEVNKRHLPWRDIENPYLIWVSEIILQQTRVIQGIEYYRRFVEAYPDIFSLAEANVDDVLKIWQGLGYYSRARNMYAAAQHIIHVCQGKFPTDYQGLIAIKGIGDYTASAIASLAFGQAVPVIDGNVNRVIARLYGIRQPVNTATGQKEIRAYAEKMMLRHDPGTYNQAIMEFGALQCVPKNPDCDVCILKQVCVAFRIGLVGVLPVKLKTVKMSTRYFHYLHVKVGEQTFIRQRSEGDIWTGLYEFPLIETAAETGLDELSRSPVWQSYFVGQTPFVERISREITHRLTHRILKIRFYEIAVDRLISGSDLIEISTKELRRYAVPVIIDQYLNKKREYF